MGGAIAGGSRLALARDFDPATFWAEVRRYGITVASYTWTMLREIADAPADPAERHHPLRLFIGAGMPRGLWRRIERRFAPARVLEFYAPTEGEAILVNLSGEKAGCKGRPLPGSAEVRLAAYDIDRGPSARARGRVRGRVRAGRGRDAADPAAGCGLDQREPAPRTVRARRRLDRHRRPVPRRRGRRPVAGRPRRGADPHRARPRRLISDHRRARRPRRGRPRGRLRGADRRPRRSGWRSRRSPCAPGSSSTPNRFPRRSPRSSPPNAPTSYTSSTRSRSRPGTGRTPPPCARPGRRRPDAAVWRREGDAYVGHTDPAPSPARGYDQRADSLT